MARFQMEKEQHPWRRMLLSAAVFLCFLGLFLAGVDSVSESTRRRQRESLETAIANGITYCYAMDGEYPQSLEELAARYDGRFTHSQENGVFTAALLLKSASPAA